MLGDENQFRAGAKRLRSSGLVAQGESSRFAPVLNFCHLSLFSEKGIECDMLIRYARPARTTADCGLGVSDFCGMLCLWEV